MKKVLTTLLVMLSLVLNSYWVNASNTYTISAIVGNSNHTPIVTEIIPNSDPVYLDNSVEGSLVKQNYSIKFRDDENDTVTYTITPESGGWAVNPTSWTVTSYDSNDEAYIFFEYISPLTAVWAKTITVTISDWPNVTIETLNVYIY